MRRIGYAVIALLLFVCPESAQNQQDTPRFHRAFVEDFSAGSSDYFNYNYRPSGEDLRYSSGVPSAFEEGTTVMMYHMDPNDPAGAGRGPEIISKDYTFYGRYSARIKVSVP